jgi:hypothetical protein
LQEKKGGAAESGDPFTDIATKILEEAEKWRNGTFQITREVYEKDEALCSALERAIWVSETRVFNLLAARRACLTVSFCVDWFLSVIV